MKKYLTIGFSILLISACKENKQQEKVVQTPLLSDTMVKMIQMDTVRYCNIDEAITLTGEIGFNDNTVVKVCPRNSGQVIESKVTLGDKVQHGQVLAIVRSADIAGNYADLSSAEADIAIAKRNLQNTESLFKNGISSEREYNEAKQNYEKTLAVKNKIEAQIQIAGGTNTTKSGTYFLTAPIDGYIVEKKVAAGSYIRPDMGDYLFTISNLQEVWVQANVFEADIPKVKEGYAVKVSTLAYPTKYFNGVIDKMSEVLDPLNMAMKVRIKIANPDLLLRPEMFAKVEVNHMTNDAAICIPSKALVTLNGNNYVVVYQSRTDLSIAEVTVLKTNGDKTYIKSGLTEGQIIITHNQLLLFQQLSNK